MLRLIFRLRSFSLSFFALSLFHSLFFLSISRSLPFSPSLSFSFPYFPDPGFLSAGVGRAGRRVGVTLIVVALRRRAVVTLYSPFAQLRELKLLDRHCTPTIEVMSLVSWPIIDARDILYFCLFFSFVFFFEHVGDGTV